MSSLNNAIRRTLLKMGNAASLTDGQLLAWFDGTHEHAPFEELVRRHGPMVLRVCRRVLNHAQDAEDAFQATFIVLMRRSRAIAKQDSVASWLYGVSYRVALKARASASRRRAQESKNAMATSAHQPATSDNGLGLALDDELNRLPEKYRAAIVLCYFEGKSNDEAARLLGCPLSTLQMRLVRGRDLLRDRLTRRGVAVASAALATQLAGEGTAATVPAALVAASVKTAGGAGQAGVSGQALAYAEAVLRARRSKKLLAMALVLLGVGGLSFGAWRWWSAGPAPQASMNANNPVSALAYSPDGKTLAGAAHKAVLLWNVDNQKQRSALHGHEQLVTSVAFGPDSDLVASGSLDGTVKLWSVAAKKELATLDCKYSVLAIAFAPDGATLAAGTVEGTVFLWELAQRRTRTTVRASNQVNAVAFAPDGKTLAVGALGVSLWDSTAGAERGTLATATPVLALAFAPDSKTLAYGNGNKVSLYDLNARAGRTDLGVYEGTYISSLAFAPGSGPLAVGYGFAAVEQSDRSHKIPEGNQLVRLLDLASGRQQAVLPAHKLRTTAVVFATDGQTLATAGWDGLVKVWQVPGTR